MDNKPKKTFEHEKLLKINILILMVGGISYGLLYMLGGDLALGIAVVLTTVCMVLGARFMQQKASENTVIHFITFVQFFAIVLFGLLGGEFAGGFTLITAVIAFNCVYFVKRIIVIQWIITDVVIVLSLFFMETLYGSIGVSFLVRSVLGINFCLLFLYLLLTWILKFKSDSAEKELTSQQLIKQVEQKMKEQEESALRIQRIFNGIKISSDSLRQTSDSMLNVASDLSANANSQTTIIEALVAKSQTMAAEINSTKQVALDSSLMVSYNAKVLADSNDSMSQAVEKISEMENSSRKIINIIKQIEDIAFQTNILALNASIEAARAGNAGKGFAVVAEEVQTLAAKSSEAASASSVLVNASIQNVQTGAKFIKDAALKMENVIEESNATAQKVEDINIIIEAQVKTVDEIMAQMDSFMEVINQTTQTAEQSNGMASDIAEQIASINKVISES